MNIQGLGRMFYYKFESTCRKNITYTYLMKTNFHMGNAHAHN